MRSSLQALLFVIVLICLSISFQFIYPTALAASIFSMQPDVIPFSQNPKSFALVVFIFIAVIYVIRLFVQYIPLHYTMLLGWARWWNRSDKVQENGQEPTESTIGDGLSPIAGLRSDRSRNDEERNDPRSLGTRAILGP